MPSDLLPRLLPSVVGGVIGALTGILLSLLGLVLFDDMARSLVYVGPLAAITGLCDVVRLGNSCGIDRESLYRDRGWIDWAIKNSIELSTMITTRPGMMSLWCLIAVLVLLDDLVVAAIVGATYGSLRSSAHVLLARSVSQDGGRRLVLRHSKLRRACGVVFLGIGSWVSLEVLVGRIQM